MRLYDKAFQQAVQSINDSKSEIAMVAYKMPEENKATKEQLFASCSKLAIALDWLNAIQESINETLKPNKP